MRNSCGFIPIGTIEYNFEDLRKKSALHGLQAWNEGDLKKYLQKI